MKIYNLALLLLFQYPFAFPITESHQPINKNKPGAVNLVFKSADGGQTWQDISEGLPENWQGEELFVNEKGVYTSVSNRIFQSTANSTAPFWKRELPPGQHPDISPGKTRIYHDNYNGQFLPYINGKSVWSSRYSVFKTAGGIIFNGSDYGLFKSTDSGKSWKQVHAGGWVMELAESNGVLLATSQDGILRSADDGEHWDRVISEGGVGIAVQCIKGGFAAITYSTTSNSRRMRTSYDGGKTWQAIDAGLKATSSISSIIEVGESFFCGHPSGIFRSSDKGKTWKLLLPSIGNKVFELVASGNVIYAIPREGGC